MMAALKIAREAGQHEQDNGPDAIGYLSMLPEVSDTLSNRMQSGDGRAAAAAAQAQAAKPQVEREEYDPMRAVRPGDVIRPEGGIYPPPRAG